MHHHVNEISEENWEANTKTNEKITDDCEYSLSGLLMLLTFTYIYLI